MPVRVEQGDHHLNRATRYPTTSDRVFTASGSRDRDFHSFFRIRIPGSGLLPKKARDRDPDRSLPTTHIHANCSSLKMTGIILSLKGEITVSLHFCPLVHLRGASLINASLTARIAHHSTKAKRGDLLHARLAIIRHRLAMRLRVITRDEQGEIDTRLDSRFRNLMSRRDSIARKSPCQPENHLDTVL